MSERHRINLCGPGWQLYNHIKDAIEYGIEPPLEWVTSGPAGTGKSMSVDGCYLALAHEYPHVPARVLLTRLTRRSLTTSTCVTIRKLLYPEHPMLQGPSDDHRSFYKYGAWEFHLAGLNNVDNLLSSEWDFADCEELRQFPKSAWEDISRGLRNNAFYKHDINGKRVPPGKGVSKIPFGILAGKTNPWTPKHWILKRAKAGKLVMVESTTRDNPAYYDSDGNITPEGAAYERRGEMWTGTRRKRLKLGLWCAAEGVIYEEWIGELEPDDPTEKPNVISIPRNAEGWIERQTLIDLDITEFYAGIDFGDDAPGCMVVAGFTRQRKLIVVAEVYARKKDLDWWEEKVRAINTHYHIRLAFCDHNRADWMRAFNDVVGAPKEGPGAVFVRADKGVDRGIQTMRLRIARKTLLFDVDALIHPPDPSLIEAGVPTCTVDEIPEYVHKRDDDDDEAVSDLKREDVPDPRCHDHGCDATRYLCVGLDYFEPANRLAEPQNPAQRKRLLALRRAMGQPFEDVSEDEEDDMADEIRRAVWGDP